MKPYGSQKKVAIGILADCTILDFFVARMPVNCTCSTVPWYLVCTSGSMFLRRLQRRTENSWDCSKTARNTVLKWSHGSASGLV